MNLPFWKHILIYFWSILIVSLGYTSLVFQGVASTNSTTAHLLQASSYLTVQVETTDNFAGDAGLNSFMQWAEEEEVSHTDNFFQNWRGDILRGITTLKFPFYTEIFIHSILIRLLDRPPDGLSD